MDIPKVTLEANSRNSPEPLDYTVTLTGLKPSNNSMVISRSSPEPDRQQEKLITSKFCP